MKSGRNILGALLALSMVGSPVFAEAANGSVPRTGTATENAEGLNGSSGGFLIPLVVIVGLVIGILLVADGDDAPVSP